MTGTAKSRDSKSTVESKKQTPIHSITRVKGHVPQPYFMQANPPAPASFYFFTTPKVAPEPASTPTSSTTQVIHTITPVRLQFPILGQSPTPMHFTPAASSSPTAKVEEPVKCSCLVQ